MFVYSLETMKPIYMKTDALTDYLLCWFQGIAPPTLNLEKPDPVFYGGFTPLSTSRKMLIRAALSNSFGFGGTNAALIFSCPC